MGITKTNEISVPLENSDYDRTIELKAFDDTKDGVKGLADTGITKIPRMFHHDKDDEFENFSSDKITINVPSIDLRDIINNKDSNLIARRRVVVEEIREASETWGFFQLVNHGVPESVMEEMKGGVRRFYEQENEVKRELYSRDRSRPVVYNSNFDLFTSKAANWRDTFYCIMAPNPPKLECLPTICRETLVEYSKHVMELGSVLFELLSEALGLNPGHLEDMGCKEGLTVICHYYPACPEPELTLGATKHTDNDFLTVLLQDQIGGLQVLHQNKWVDVSYIPGSLVINIGDLLQLITNDKFKSVEHRVVANNVGPRISIASFFSTSLRPSSKLYGPLKELVSEDNPPKYRETTVHDYVSYSIGRGLDGTSHLLHLRI
ncbi:1-aminocyclopropane-1-carboxylate oxidase-like protein 1-like [Senna tora]|uniref:1-aminocyclopropane-1-carboxylate oxidase-like protein 1-like n=1 Tax=Senna tora TaxID=362788 RepID=A0A834W5W4_9FABA|nr:1-aminocyclopropane-1-carboxylate oxidase-like protein 1-like [Senna tora]